MPEITQSLWQIEQGWSTLLTEREDALEQLAACQLAAERMPLQDESVAIASARLVEIDEAIVAHAKNEVRKVDGIRGIWKHLQMQHAAAVEESRIQANRAKAIEANLNALKSAVQITMEEMPWVPGKPRKLEGKTGSIYLKGNGGRRAVTITDEAMVPDEFCVFTLRLSSNQSPALLAYIRSVLQNSGPQGPKLERAPLLAALYDGLNAKCGWCDGEGHVTGVNADDPTSPRFTAASILECESCSGTGTTGVPGAYLAPLGQHVEVR